MSTPPFPGTGESVQAGPELRVPMRLCDSVGVTFALEPPGVSAGGSGGNPAVGMVSSSLAVTEQRLQVGAGRVAVQDPDRLPCEDGGSCGTWEGWSFTVESPGQGEVTFQTPVRWGSVDATTLDTRGQLTVTLRMSSAG